MPIADTIIVADKIISVDQNDTIFTDCALVIKGEKIVDILPSDEIDKYQSKQTIYKSLLIPGLINAHTHSAMNLFKGLACDQPFEVWLKDYIWQAEAKFVDEDFVEVGSTAAIVEMIKSGTTCFNDMYFFADMTAKIADKIGVRLGLGLIFLDFPCVWARDFEGYLSKAQSLYEQYKNHRLIKPILAPHAPYTVSNTTLQSVLSLSEKWQTPVHIHLHETTNELTQSLQDFGVRPLERLDQLGLLNENLIAVHMVHLTELERQKIRDKNVSVVHCPKSNLKLGSGIADIWALDKLGVNVAIGTDSSASNNNLDMLNEMQITSLLAKGMSLDATAVGAYAALKMATINGAKSMGLEDEIGSLEIGKQADVVAFDLTNVACQPWFDVVSQLIYSASKQQVCDVWVGGKPLLRDKKLVEIDEVSLLDEIKIWQDKITTSS